MCRRLAITVCCLLALGGASAGIASAATWPFSTFQLGLMDGENGATALRASAPFGLRYQYLAGGINTNNSWQQWGRGQGEFVTDYIADSELNGTVPVFSYYEMRQSQPGSGQSDESTADLGNLDNVATMRAYYLDLQAFFRKAALASGPVVLQVEPDLWGYIQRAARNDDAGTVPAAVASTGMSDLQGLPNTAAGFAKAVVQLRDNYASNVVLGYHLSIWGTGKDITVSDETDPSIDQLATRSTTFYKSLAATFDVVFGEFADRDSGYAEKVNGTPHDAAWWDDADFARHIRYLADVRAGVGLPIVLWQIPEGNTLYRAVDDTTRHYQDNRPQWLLGASASAHLGRYVAAGVVALLFGPGQGDDTCACDGAKDGITNPSPIDANDLFSLSADDDGGYLRARAAAFYARGALALPTSLIKPKTTSKPTTTPRHPGAFTSRATVTPTGVRRGATLRIKASARSTTSQTALFDIEVYPEAGGKGVYQRYFDHQSFHKGRVRSFVARWTVPATLAPGRYTIKLGVFGVGFGTLRHWNDSAAHVVVR